MSFIKVKIRNPAKAVKFLPIKCPPSCFILWRGRGGFYLKEIISEMFPVFFLRCWWAGNGRELKVILELCSDCQDKITGTGDLTGLWLEGYFD